DGGVDEFLQILQTRFGLVSLLRLERVLVAGFEDCGLDDVGNGRVGVDDCGLRIADFGLPALPKGRATAPIFRHGRATAPIFRNGRATAPIFRNGRATAPIFPNGRATAPIFRRATATLAGGGR